MSEPIWLSKARTYVGITEGAGAKDNATILGWAKKLGRWVAKSSPTIPSPGAGCSSPW